MIIKFSGAKETRHEYKRKREKEIAQIGKVISSWDMKELKSYIYNHNQDYPCSDAGMAAILERFIKTNEFQVGDMAEELKIGFDIVLAISRNNKIYFQTTDLIYDFIKHFAEVIHSFDRQSAQTYYHKLIKAYEKSVEMVNKKLEIEQEIRVKY